MRDGLTLTHIGRMMLSSTQPIPPLPSYPIPPPLPSLFVLSLVLITGVPSTLACFPAVLCCAVLCYVVVPWLQLHIHSMVSTFLGIAARRGAAFSCLVACMRAPSCEWVMTCQVSCLTERSVPRFMATHTHAHAGQGRAGS